ncbi:MAG: pyruvate-flavodoxin oxidoreductase, partial [Candidatus Thiodiazotropha sp. 6PDIVS]
MEQTTLFIVVGGLLVLTLVLASIIQRYNDFVEERNQKVQRILNRVTEIEALIQRIPGLPVPVEVET